jgi:DedD protein
MEFNPKHRIIGAIVIVALAVIFLPMILDEREPPSEIKKLIEIPSRSDVGETKVVVSPVSAPEVKASGDASTPAVDTPVAETATKPELKPATPVKKPEPEPAQAPARVKSSRTTPEHAAEKITKGWVVQVGTFSNAENAAKLRDSLRSHGHPVHAESVTINGGKAVRLRVGPFREKSEAVKALAQIQKESGTEGVVQTYP